MFKYLFSIILLSLSITMPLSAAPTQATEPLDVATYSHDTASLMIVGDSLSAGYQMRLEESWPSLLPEQLNNQGINVNVINTSISGDTTGNALARLPKLLEQHHPDWVLIELGANDGLRGFSPAIIEKNLNTIIDQVEGSGSKALLMQIQLPPNYGKRYTQSVENLYPAIAKQHNIPLLPFFLKEVIIKPEWMKQDGLHPKAVAQPWIADYMAKQLKPILSQ